MRYLKRDFIRVWWALIIIINKRRQLPKSKMRTLMSLINLKISMGMCKWTNNTLAHPLGMLIPPMLGTMIIIVIGETPHNTKIFTRIVIVVTLSQATTTKRLMGNLHHCLLHKAYCNSSNLCRTSRINNINSSSSNCWRQTRQSTRLRCARTG